MAMVIRNNEDATEALRRIKSGDFDERLKFAEWPKFEMRIQGEDFDGGIPTRIMPTLIDLQNAINKEYALALGRDSGRLTSEQRRDVELIVYVDEGSTQFIADMAEALNKITSITENMNRNAAAAIISLGLAYAAYSGWAATLQDRADERKINLDLARSEAEIERMRIMSDLARSMPRVDEQMREADAFHAKTLRRLEPGDNLLVEDRPLVNGELGHDLGRKAPEETLDSRLDGSFVILNVVSGGVRDGFRLKVRPASGGDELNVTIPKGAVSDNDIDALKAGEWSKQAVRMQMNIRKRGEKIVSATLIEAGLTGNP